MKKFKFSYSLLVILLLAAGMLVSVVSIALNVSLLFSDSVPSAYNVVSIITVLLVCAAFLALAVSMLVNSYYSIDEKFFTLRWGLLSNKLEIATMTRVELDSEKKTLTVFYGEENYFVIKSATIPFPDLITELRKINGKIVVEFSSEVKNDEKR